ncbi:MAG: PIN domain-containing protein [Chloroflexia bacterium]|nr:PIN domain-containing protein [Chloroflexia bacterium]
MANNFEKIIILDKYCKILYSEDMQHNQLIEDQLLIINPFKNDV